MKEGLPAKHGEPRVNEKLHFLESHKTEILPLLDDEERAALLSTLENGSSNTTAEYIDSILERFETKVFSYVPEDPVETSKRILLTTDAPGSYRGVRPVLETLLHDKRVGGVTALVSGVAGIDFKSDFPEFTQTKKEGMVFADILEEVESHPVDITISTVTVQNGSESLTTLGGTKVLRANKNFLMVDGWGVVGTTFAPERIKDLERLDGIFCNDEFAKAIIAHKLPGMSPERIYSYGLPGVEHLEVEKAEAYRTATREKLDIPEDAYVVLYLGDVSSDYADLDVPEDSNVQTFQKTVEALAQFAEEHLDRTVVLIVRPHPRGLGTPDGEALLHPEHLSERIRLINGMKPLSINEVSYAADTIVSIMSTENLFAPMRGRQSVFLAYEGIGEKVLTESYGKELVPRLEDIDGVSLIASPHDLVRTFERLSILNPGVPESSSDATKKIVDTVLK
jgi:hypothetical protein